MDWIRLLNTKRLYRPNSNEQEQYRSPFQRDLDKIVFSSAFRRLQDKTQVHPLAVNDYVRTRLTHSMEVSSVGRSLGTIVGDEIIKRYHLIETSAGDFGDIVSAACLAHDIGNPPFGHAGEDAIRDWFKRNISLLEGFSEGQKNDFLAFEGNAQGFRIVSRLQNFDNDGGLQLTCATLGTFTKYPRESAIDAALVQNDIGGKKFGFYQSERFMFEAIASELGLEQRYPDTLYWSRHPLAFLVEAADDICYTIIDFEDGHKLNKLEFGETEALLIDLIGSENIGRYPEIQHNDKKISYLRAKAIGILIEYVSRIFIDSEADILAGRFDRELLSHIPQYQTFREIIQLTKQRVYAYRAMMEKEMAGVDIIEQLLDAFIPAVLAYTDTQGNPETLDRQQNMLVSMLEIPQSVSPDDRYTLFQLVTDYIAGMTDTYAVELSRKITQPMASLK